MAAGAGLSRAGARALSRSTPRRPTACPPPGGRRSRRIRGGSRPLDRRASLAPDRAGGAVGHQRRRRAPPPDHRRAARPGGAVRRPGGGRGRCWSTDRRCSAGWRDAERSRGGARPSGRGAGRGGRGGGSRRRHFTAWSRCRPPRRGWSTTIAEAAALVDEVGSPALKTMIDNLPPPGAARTGRSPR